MSLKGKMVFGVLVLIAINGAISWFGIHGLDNVGKTYSFHWATIG